MRNKGNEWTQIAQIVVMISAVFFKDIGNEIDTDNTDCPDLHGFFEYKGLRKRLSVSHTNI
jgi:hypothetical protein